MFLLMCGDTYYPRARTDDWKRCYSTWSEARAAITGDIGAYSFEGRRFDWFCIVDLHDWIVSTDVTG